MKRKRAAHFVSWPYLVDNPSNHTLINALLELGYSVDVFTSDPDLDLSQYGAYVRSRHAQFGYRWLATHLLHPRWLGYDLFCGTTEEPMAAAGLLARIYRKRCITVADEIKSGSTRGTRSERWKALCRFGMRASQLTIVNEAERIEIQRQYAGLPSDQLIVIMPNCFPDPPAPGDRLKLRRERGFPEDALVVCYSGVFSLGNGATWFAKALAEKTDVWFWGQVVPQDPMAGALLPWLQGRERLVLEPGPLGWRFPWVSMAAADIGIVVYLQDAPQFMHMGTASQRMCMFLAMGVPVIASRQPSFAFVETYDCGILVDTPEEFVRAIDSIRPRLAQMRANALRCAREYIDAPRRYRELVEAISCQP
jgi:glycosyltransferase involved in cell wall biosynthesis